MKDISIKRKYTNLFFIIGLIVAAIFMWIYFSNICIDTDFPYHNNVAAQLFSDNVEKEASHVESYLLYHFLVKIFQAIFGGNMDIATAIVMVGCNVATILIARKMIFEYAKPQTVFQKYVGDVIALSIVFVGCIIQPFTNYSFYLPQGAPNVWHNPTFLFVRPFGMLSVWFFIKAINAYKNKEKMWVPVALFSLFSILTCYAKPSFTLVFLPAMGLYVFICIIKNFKQNFLRLGLPMLAAVTPTILLALWQMYYVETVNKSMALEFQIKFGTVFGMTPIQAIAGTIGGMVFVLFVLFACGYKEILKKNAWYIISLLALFFGWACYYFISESGGCGNYFWSYGLALNFAFLISAIVLMRSDVNKRIKVIGSILFLAHLAFGGIYFICLSFLGHSYYAGLPQ